MPGSNERIICNVKERTLDPDDCVYSSATSSDAVSAVVSILKAEMPDSSFISEMVMGPMSIS
jgi:hypothetical protein